jgi:hypothetical protein
MRGPKEKLPDAKVEFYSGYRGQETPTSIIIQGTEYPIDEIISRKRISDQKTGDVSETFECRSGRKHFRIEISGSSVSVMVG